MRNGEDGRDAPALGVARTPHKVPLLADTSRQRALDYFVEGGAAPLLLKSNAISTVHRSVPLDLVLVPVMEGGRVVGLSIHAGLWTSAALASPPHEVPVLRTRLAALQPSSVSTRAAYRQGADPCADRAAA